MKKTALVFLLSAAALILSGGATLGAQDVVSVQVREPPLLDGSADDHAWGVARSYTVKDMRLNVPITIKSVHSADSVYFLVSYPDPTADLLHKPWLWDKGLTMYTLGPQKEDTFIFRWSMEAKDVDLSDFSDNDFTSDLWYWKANRTNPAGYADDKYDVLSSLKEKKSAEIISKTGQNRYLLRGSDAGKECYEQVVPIDYQGDTVNQFKVAAPVGSRGDVKAKGAWKGGVWCIEFARKLRTGHADDLQFEIKPGNRYLFGVSIKSLYGEPIDDTQPNYYGQGRISEPLYLLLE